MKNCQYCSREFVPGPGCKGIYCCRPCKDADGKGKTTQKRLDNIIAYNNKPATCKGCDIPMPYDSRNNTFCSSSCAATFNNTYKTKHGRYVKVGICSNGERNKRVSNIRAKEVYPSSKVYFKNCTACSTIFVCSSKTSYRKTCGPECSIHARVGYSSYQNGRRKNIYYLNPSENTTVLLESSWEERIAIFLDNNNISWTRPKYIKWIDSNGKKRLYYPDFYLPKYDLYLDPKNTYGMSVGKEKMEAVSKIINVVYGDIDYLIALLKELVCVERLELP